MSGLSGLKITVVLSEKEFLMDVKAKVSETEWQTRVDLAACYRLMPMFGMSDLVYNHITARIPGEDDRLLINPFGYMYEEITASSLITINLNGDVLLNPHTEYTVNPAGQDPNSTRLNSSHVSISYAVLCLQNN